MEKNLTIIEIIDTFTFYGIDVILLAAATCALTQISKVTFLKRINKKLLTFLPFTIGTVFYAAYATLINWDITYLINEYLSVLEHGISVGAVATLLYVLYEQFVREKNNLSATENVVSTLIDGYVPTDCVESVAKQISQAIEKDVTGSGAKRAAEILASNSEEGISERDIQLLSKLIIETLAHINAS